MRKSGKEPSVRRTVEALRRGASTLNLKGTHSLHRFQGLNVRVSCPLLQEGESRSVTSIPWALVLTSSPFWPSSTLGGNRGREQGGFLLVGLQAGVWREGDRQTHREKKRES